MRIRMKVGKWLALTGLALAGLTLAALGTPAIAQEQLTLKDIGKKVCVDVGTVKDTQGENAKGRFVVILEENHAARACQIELALMLSRLYRTYHLRDVGLEGYVAGRTFDAAWFHKLDPASTKADKLAVATQLLKEGEINAVEFTAFVYPDLKVHPIDDKDFYQKVPITEAADYAPFTCLIEIAKMTANETTKKEHQRLKRRFDGKKTISVVHPDVVFLKADPWTKKQYKILTDSESIRDIVEEIATYKEIRKKAREIGADKNLDKQTKEGMDTLIQFLEGADKRSDAMAKAILTLAREVNGPIAMRLGASHSKRVCATFQAANQPYLLLSPNALRDAGRFSALSSSQYGRKLKGRSVGSGPLEEALNKEEPPRPTIDQPWLKTKADLYLLTAKMGTASEKAKATTGGSGKPPNGPPPIDPARPFGMDPSDFDGKGFRVDRNTIKWVHGEVIFKVTFNSDDPLRKSDLWVRVGKVSGLRRGQRGDRDVDDYLKAALKEVRSGVQRVEEKVKRAEDARAKASKQAKDAEEAEVEAKKKEENAKDKNDKEADKEAEEAKKREEEAEKRSQEAKQKAKEAVEAARKEQEAVRHEIADKTPPVQVSPEVGVRFANSEAAILAMPVGVRE